MSGNITIVIDDRVALELRELIEYGRDDFRKDMGEEAYAELTKLSQFIERHTKKSSNAKLASINDPVLQLI